MTATHPAAAASRSTPRWRDLRDWLRLVEELGELRYVEGASWQEDIGAVTELLDHTPNSPAVLFDAIPGYPRGYRVLSNANATRTRQAITLGLDPATASHETLLAWWRRTLRQLEPLPPVEVPDGPVFEVVQRGDEVDLYQFPAPVWHPGDGGRFIGTASLNILRDPDTGWVNVGTYRNMIQDRNHLGVWISPGKHGRLIRDRWQERGERAPICVSVGHDPLLFMAACLEGLPPGLSEYEWAGGAVGRPVEVVRAPITGLPIPAHAEIVLEGYIDFADMRVEGPYGEFTGYYASGAPTLPTIEVQAVYHRRDPIILGCPQGKPPHEDNQFLAYLRTALIWEHLERAGVPDVVGVWSPPLAANRFCTIVAIRQRYPGHARQVGVLAANVGATAYMSRYIIVVDDDVDVTNMDDVLFAVFTRSDPERSIEILRRCWSGPLDPAIPPERHGFNSRVIIDACRPFEWRERFPPAIVTPSRSAAIRRRWGHLLAARPEDGPVRPAEG
ncbi:MAG: UbiD family decarboxylase [Chloroflexi bacterium]|nr:UbiD family decarboxylase [Chloroflexota bacterium]